MKAIILAGGQGTRLRAVTGGEPKPLVPLLGRPLMEHILRLLGRNGIREIRAALSYRPERIMDTFGDGSALGLSLSYHVERQPRGTAGAVRACRDFIGDEDVLVMSGDVACDFDLAALCRRHRESGAAASIALTRSETPLRFGLAVTDADDRIRAFVEKPSWPQVVTDLISTGIYVLSPRALGAIPADTAYDFGRDLFPALLRRGELLLGLPMAGYFCDVGTPESYYRCCLDALQGRLRLEPGEGFSLSSPESAQAQAQEIELGPVLPCRSRAALMGALSELMLEMNADLSDGIRLRAPGYSLHVSPLSDREAVRVQVEAPDTEFAAAMTASVEEIIRALDL